MALTNRAVRAKLLAAIERPVRYKYPGGGIRVGTLKDRIVLRTGWSGWPGSTHQAKADYWNVIDLIEFPDSQHRFWIRFGYYRRTGDVVRWAGQNTITERPHIMKRLFAQGAKRKKWFRDLLPSNRD